METEKPPSKEEVNSQLQKLMKSDSQVSVEEARKVLDKVWDLREGFGGTPPLDYTDILGEADPEDYAEDEKERAKENEKNKAEIDTLKKSLVEKGAFDSEDTVEKALNIVELEAAE
ncbi:MAG: hypothetical protein Q7S28_02130 [bacterium]|nr:hypothetical protein [bacterium]